MKEEIINKIYEAKKNLIVNGDMSTRKTINVGFPLVEKMIKENESLFILDCKTEYLNQYYDLLKEKNYNIVIINYRDLNNSEGWNILEYPYQLYKSGQIDKALDFLEQIAKQIFGEISTTDSFWSESASNLFMGLVLGLFEDADIETINLSSVNAMISGIDAWKNRGIKEYFKYKDNLAFTYASGTVFAPDETRGSIVSMARQKLLLLSSRELLNKQMSKTTFSFDDVVNKPTAIFLISKDEASSLNTLASVFINQLYIILVDKQVKNRFNFVLDNFDTIENVNDFKAMMGSGMARNIKFTLFTRSKSNLEEHYGNYINALFDEIRVTEKEIKLSINDEVMEIENPVTEIEPKAPEIIYPHLDASEIKVFDLQSYVKEKSQTMMNSFANISTSPQIDRMLENIDKKLSTAISSDEAFPSNNDVNND